jgi:hypothetical protein
MVVWRFFFTGAWDIHMRRASLGNGQKAGDARYCDTTLSSIAVTCGELLLYGEYV